MNNTYTLRKARKEDLPSIFSLVKALAVFEKAEEEVSATLEEYQKNFQLHFDCWLALDQAEVVGIALYYYGFSTWKGKMLYLDDLYIAENHRRKGLAKKLLFELIKEGRKLDCQLIKWQVLDWNKPAIELYASLGMQLERNWYNCKGMLSSLGLSDK
jgi:GNAT superfamily N-acetyltransferase